MRDFETGTVHPDAPHNVTNYYMVHRDAPYKEPTP